MPVPDAAITDPAIIVHSLGHAVAALRAAAACGRRVALLSAPAAGGYAGAGWFRALVDAAREAVPRARFSAFLDCGDAPGPVLAALRAEVAGAVFTGRSDVAWRLADIARQHGVHLVLERPVVVLDLGTDFFADEPTLIARCTAFLDSSAGTDSQGQVTRS
jgi:hypothetical protein